jgi:hypothetical protein
MNWCTFWPKPETWPAKADVSPGLTVSMRALAPEVCSLPPLMLTPSSSSRVALLVPPSAIEPLLTNRPPSVSVAPLASASASRTRQRRAKRLAKIDYATVDGKSGSLLSGWT